MPRAQAPQGPTAAVPAAASTLVRGLSVLELVAAAGDGIGVTDVAAKVGTDKSTASRLLATMRELGYVQQRARDRRYVLGSRCLWLAQAYRADHEDLVGLARPQLMGLRDATGETVYLAVREGVHVVYVAQEQSGQTVTVQSVIGTRTPLQRTAMGRAILATMGEADRDRLLDQIRANAAVSHAALDLEEVRADVRQARIRGWAAVDRHDDVTRLAAAITDPRGEPIAAITLAGPSFRVDPRVDELGAAVARVAGEVSGALSG
ncbi:IclR family transcriptional regulator [Occultella glacieicola]|uniref:IclR family transcriptional regulator n=1 Tax=Occultella glacieicola TaxID=2518684 RepID=A0ABY2DZP5_9MICO|nr:IclR family transcriptional regulator [Occultella glacieicola]TDE89532.1 IclR family transcriptional regulator [Occultella glacieicola]